MEEKSNSSPFSDETCAAGIATLRDPDFDFKVALLGNGLTELRTAMIWRLLFFLLQLQYHVRLARCFVFYVSLRLTLQNQERLYMMC